MGQLTSQGTLGSLPSPVLPSPPSQPLPPSPPPPAPETPLHKRWSFILGLTGMCIGMALLASAFLMIYFVNRRKKQQVRGASWRSSNVHTCTHMHTRARGPKYRAGSGEVGRGRRGGRREPLAGTNSPPGLHTNGRTECRHLVHMTGWRVILAAAPYPCVG
ncbi:hypothetical protein Vretifemale_4557 [Volvox reticuliferus]|uniref:Uncharacterized protein n=1 Tax=Volvox reticuliferus TaxID=1737510 RepID=A0A8J4C4S0_9CHLO|nr:hypothetical protein Vretifemale_4557 [Volvox reticuliferus]